MNQATRPPYDCTRAILEQLAACGPCTLDELRHACRQQASDYSPEQVTLALMLLIRDCRVDDTTEPGDDESSYDLPN